MLMYKKTFIPLVNVDIVVCGDLETCEMLVNRRGFNLDTTGWATVDGLTVCVGGVLYLAFKRYDPNTVTHEITHAVSFIHQMIGSELDHSNDEWPAYLAGHIAEVVYKFLHTAAKIKNIEWGFS